MWTVLVLLVLLPTLAGVALFGLKWFIGWLDTIGRP
jgi:hypothetical protein